MPNSLKSHIETLREMFAVAANERRMKEADALAAAIEALSRQGGETDHLGRPMTYWGGQPGGRASEAGDCQMCIRCGQPTMHMGNLCFGCTKAIAAAPAPGGAE